MKTKIQKFGAWLMAVALAFVGAGAWGANVAQIGVTQYPTLQAAFDAVKGGDTIELLVDKLTVADYGSETYGKYTEITAQGTAHTVGEAMAEDALANVVLRRSDKHQISLGQTGVITIVGKAGTGTEFGSLDFSGCCNITVRNLKFDAANAITAIDRYNPGGGNTSKEGVANCNWEIVDSGETSSVIDAAYSQDSAKPAGEANSKSHDIVIDSCLFFGTPSGDKYAAVFTGKAGFIGSRNYGWVVQNCKFAGNNYIYLHLQAFQYGYQTLADSTHPSLTVVSNEFGTADTKPSDAVISASSSQSTIIIKDNIFRNWTAGKKAMSFNPGNNPAHFIVTGNRFDLKDKTATSFMSKSLGYDNITVNGLSAKGTPEELQEMLWRFEDVNLYAGKGTYDGAKNNGLGSWGVDPNKKLITYELNGGENNLYNPIQYNGERALTLLPATRGGYVFAGWYDNAELEGTALAQIATTAEPQPLTLYAKWVPIVAEAYVNDELAGSYASLAAAVEGAPENALVKLLQDCDETVETERTTNFTLDANGKNFTGSVTGPGDRILKLNDDGTYTYRVVRYVAQIGETKYEHLSDAVAAVPEGLGTATTIRMIGDEMNTPAEVLPEAVHDGIKTCVVVPANKSIILDLNSCTIECRDDGVTGNFAFLSVLGELVVDDLSEAKSGTIVMTPTTQGYGTFNSVIQSFDGIVTIRNGLVKNAATAGLCYAVEVGSWHRGGHCIIEGGSVVGLAAAVRVHPNFGDDGTYELAKSHPISFKMTGGELTGGFGFVYQNDSGVSAYESKIDISGGVINYSSYGIYFLYTYAGEVYANLSGTLVVRPLDETATDTEAIITYPRGKTASAALGPQDKKGKINVTGGTYQGAYFANIWDKFETDDVVISGGKFSGEAYRYDGTPFIEGGFFADEPADCYYPDYVVDGKAIARVGSETEEYDEGFRYTIVPAKVCLPITEVGVPKAGGEEVRYSYNEYFAVFQDAVDELVYAGQVYDYDDYLVTYEMDRIVLCQDDDESVVGGQVPFTLVCGDYAYSGEFTPAEGFEFKDNQDRTFSYRQPPSTICVSSAGSDAEGNGTAEHPYASLAKAIAEAKSGDTVKLLSGLTENFVLGEAKSLSFDLGGNTLSGSVTVSAGSIVLSGAGTITGTVTGATVADGFRMSKYQLAKPEDGERVLTDTVYRVLAKEDVAVLLRDATENVYYFKTLGEASCSFARDGKPYTGAIVITMLKDNHGCGLRFTQKAVNVLVDFGGFTYTVDALPLAGSAGTETQAMQILKYMTITLKNGTLVAAHANIKDMIRSYARSLTLDNMRIDGSQMASPDARYTLYCNSDEDGSATHLKNGTEIVSRDGLISVYVEYDGKTHNVYFDDDTIKANGMVRYAETSSVAEMLATERIVKPNGLTGLVIPEECEWTDYTDGKKFLDFKKVAQITVGEVTTKFYTLEDAVSAVGDGDVTIAILGDKSKLTPPKGWEFKQVGEAWTLVRSPVARIDEATYPSLQKAVDAAEDGDVIVIVADINYDYPTGPVVKNGDYSTNDPRGKTLTLDLNGHAIAAKIDSTFTSHTNLRDLIFNAGDMTVMDSVGTGSITISESNDTGWANSCSIFGNSGKMTIVSGTYANNGGDSMSYVVDSRCDWSARPATLDIQGGTFECPKYTVVRALTQFVSGSENVSSAVAVSGGTFTGKRCFYVFYGSEGVSGPVNIEIRGGDFTAANRVFHMDLSGLAANPASIGISGGSFTCDDVANNSIFHVDTVYGAVQAGGGVAVAITDGMFACGQGVVFEPLAGKETMLAAKASGGIYSAQFDARHVVAGRILVPNTDPATKAAYPWMIGQQQLKPKTDEATADASEEAKAAIPAEKQNQILGAIDQVKTDVTTAATSDDVTHFGESGLPEAVVNSDGSLDPDVLTALKDGKSDQEKALIDQWARGSNSTEWVEIALTQIDVGLKMVADAVKGSADEVSYDVVPLVKTVIEVKNEQGEVVASTTAQKQVPNTKLANNPITFRLGMTWAVGEQVKVYRDDNYFGITYVKAGTDGNYVELTSNHFSTFKLLKSNVTTVCEVDGLAYESVAAAIAANADKPTTVFKLTAPCNEQNLPLKWGQVIDVNGLEFSGSIAPVDPEGNLAEGTYEQAKTPDGLVFSAPKKIEVPTSAEVGAPKIKVRLPLLPGMNKEQTIAALQEIQPSGRPLWADKVMGTYQKLIPFVPRSPIGSGTVTIKTTLSDETFVRTAATARDGVSVKYQLKKRVGNGDFLEYGDGGVKVIPVFTVDAAALEARTSWKIETIFDEEY